MTTLSNELWYFLEVVVYFSHRFYTLLLQTENPQRELLVLSRERQILVMQIEALRAEAQQAESDLHHQHHRHQTELHCLREESLQVGVYWVYIQQNVEFIECLLVQKTIYIANYNNSNIFN